MLKRISLRSNRNLIAAYSSAGRDVNNWLVYIPESGSEFQRASRAELNRLIGKKLARKFHFLVINKPGQGPRSNNARVFEQSFRRQGRVHDALTVLRKIIPEEHNIFLVGYSEGAYLAPQIAREDLRVKGVVLMGGGTRGWLKEELSNAGPREKREVRRQIREIYEHPRSTQKWHGFSYATWYSYRADSTLTALKALRIPVLAILGRRDRTIDFKTTLTDLSRLSRTHSITVKVFSNCGHSFVSHWADAWHLVRKFLLHANALKGSAMASTIAD